MSDTPGTQSEPNSLTPSNQGSTDSGGTNTTVPASPTNAANNSGGGNPQDLTALITVLTALPEQLARSVKEAVGTPAKPAEKPAETAETKPTETAKPAEKPAETKTPGRKSFAEWWGGGN